MQRQRGQLVPVGEVIADLDGPVKAIRDASPQAVHHFSRFDQVNQLVSASEADPDLGFMARMMALCYHPREGLTPLPKRQNQNLPYRKRTKNKRLTETAAERARGPTTKPNPKPESKPRIAAAERRVKPPARLLRCATALRVTAPLGCGSRRLVWPKGSLPARPHSPPPPFPS